MNTDSIDAFLDELYIIEKSATVKRKLMRGLVKLRQGSRAASGAVGAAERGAYRAAGKVIPPDKLPTVALKSSEILAKFIT